VAGKEGRMWAGKGPRARVRADPALSATLGGRDEQYVFGDLQISEDHFYINNKKTMREGSVFGMARPRAKATWQGLYRAVIYRLLMYKVGLVDIVIVDRALC
jgi:hypothetical protein